MRNCPDVELGVNAKTSPSRNEGDAGESTARCSRRHGKRLYPLSRDQKALQTARARSGVTGCALDNGKAHMATP